MLAVDELAAPRLTKWPFLVGDAMLLALAAYFCFHTKQPLQAWEMSLATLCVAVGAALGIAPFVLEHRASLRLAEAGALTTVVSKIQNLESIAAQISSATGNWHEVRQSADATAAAARAIAERMTAEVKGFSELMTQLNDREKASLKLELEKARRAETDWLQVLVRVLDHVYALHVGAVRSSQPALIEQVGNFQNACREAARRIGLTPFTAAAAEPFDGQRHQLTDDKLQPAPDATVAETIAAGYTFQGRLLRPALVRLNNGEGEPQTG
jgi:molecular chaperone GrpE (heat shock protein)